MERLSTALFPKPAQGKNENWQCEPFFQWKPVVELLMMALTIIVVGRVVVIAATFVLPERLVESPSRRVVG